MTCWIRFERDGAEGFGKLDGETVEVFEGDLFDSPRPTGETLAREALRLLMPCRPGKMICLWNNFHALAAKLGMPEPPEPLYFLKAPSSFLAPEAELRRPASYDGKVIFEGELGIVIGRRASSIGESQAAAHIFGYTCINDVTAVDIIAKDPTFAQWSRAKSFDGFGPFGPTIATALDPAGLTLRTVLNGSERQNYPLDDMIFSPPRLVSLISHDMTLEPGDVIACGTSVGVGSMKEPRNRVEVTIEGVGTLGNWYENEP